MSGIEVLGLFTVIRYGLIFERNREKTMLLGAAFILPPVFTEQGPTVTLHTDPDPQEEETSLLHDVTLKFRTLISPIKSLRVISRALTLTLPKPPSSLLSA